MNETVAAIVAIAFVFVAVPVLLLWLRDRRATALRRRARSPAQLAAERAAHTARIITPDWGAVERHLRRAPPAALRELYADRTLVTTQDQRYANDEVISTFEPLDGRGLIDTQAPVGPGAVTIATTDFGDLIYLQIGPVEADTVYVYRHDGGDTEVFAESVAEMLDVLRSTKRDV